MKPISSNSSFSSNWLETILSTKLTIPNQGASLVRRERLTGLLIDGLHCPLITIVAPAGYGKTTLLVDWLSNAGLDARSVVWLSLDTLDNNPARFWSYIAAGLLRLPEPPNSDLQTLMRYSMRPEELGLLNPLINEIFQLGYDLYLILDDLHLIQNPAIYLGLAYLIEHQPANLHLVFSSREIPALSLSRKLAQRQLIQITTQDLSFTVDETGQFLSNAMQLEVDSNQIDQLFQATEGWIAGIQLAALSLQGEPGSQRLKRGVPLSLRHVNEFLIDEVLAHQDPEMREFLLRTSILFELSPELCDAVLERSDSQVMLDRIDRANLFIRSIDERLHWFRYHPLFSNALVAVLEREYPDLPKQLHRRAYQWLSQNHYVDKAVSHALAAGDQEAAAELVETCAMQAILQYDLLSLAEWTSRFTAELIVRNPRLGIYTALVNLLLGHLDLVEPHLVSVETASQAKSLPDDEKYQLTWRVAALRAVIETLYISLPSGISHIQNLLQTAPPGETYFYGFLRNTLSEAYFQSHDYTASGETYAAGRDYDRRYNQMNECIHTTSGLAKVRKEQGRLFEARLIYQEALEIAIHNDVYTGARAMAESGLLEIALERNETEIAGQWARELAAHFYPSGGKVTTWLYQSQLAVRLAHYYFVTGDLKSCLTFFEKWIQVNNPSELSIHVPGEITDLQTKLWIAQGEIGAGLRQLSQRIRLIQSSGWPCIREQIGLARLYLAQEEYERALQILDSLEPNLAKDGMVERRLEVLILQALALAQIHSQMEAAVERLDQALAIGEPEGYSLIFTEEGQAMRNLLHIVLLRSRVPSRSRRDYIHQLLSFLEPAQEEPGDQWFQSPTIRNTPIFRTFSNRELEVYQLLTGGIAVKQIALQLQISLNTTRAHIRNIYRKTGCHTRQELIEFQIKNKE